MRSKAMSITPESDERLPCTGEAASNPAEDEAPFDEENESYTEWAQRVYGNDPYTLDYILRSVEG